MSMEHIYTEIKQLPCMRIARDCWFVVHDLSCIDNTCLERSVLKDFYDKMHVTDIKGLEHILRLELNQKQTKMLNQASNSIVK